MSEYTATVAWQRDGATFTDNRFSRGHRWQFDGGVEVPASASPQVVRPPLSVEQAVDPEEALVAALSSCHMLFFLAFAQKAGYVVDSYRDQAVGKLEKRADGRTAMTVVTLRPEVQFNGERLPDRAELDALHEKSHQYCYIANSVTSEVRCEPVIGG